MATRSSAARAVRYLAAGLLLAAWARLTRKPLPRPAGREWAWLAALAAVGLAGCSVLMIQATRAADPASVGVVIGAAPLVIIIATAITARRRPVRRVLLAAAVVAAGSALAQLAGAGAGTASTASTAGLLWSAGALGGVVGTSLLAAPVLRRLGALAVTVYACGLAGLMLLAAAAATRAAGGPPVLRVPTATQLAALAYLTIVVTAIVFLAWYGALERLGVDRTGLFNGLVPVTSLAAVALTGTGAITPPSLLGALAVLAGVILGLHRGNRLGGDLGRRQVRRQVARHPDLSTSNPTTRCHPKSRSTARPERQPSDPLLGRGVGYPVKILVEDLAEHRLPGRGVQEQGDGRAELHRVDLAEDLLRGTAGDPGQDGGGLDQAGAEDGMGQVGPGLGQRGDRVGLGRRAVPQAGDLREDEPHPVAGLAAAPQLSRGPIVGPARVLGRNESLEVIRVFRRHVATLIRTPIRPRPAGHNHSRADHAAASFTGHGCCVVDGIAHAACADVARSGR